MTTARGLHSRLRRSNRDIFVSIIHFFCFCSRISRAFLRFFCFLKTFIIAVFVVDDRFLISCPYENWNDSTELWKHILPPHTSSALTLARCVRLPLDLQFSGQPVSPNLLMSWYASIFPPHEPCALPLLIVFWMLLCVLFYRTWPVRTFSPYEYILAILLRSGFLLFYSFFVIS